MDDLPKHVSGPELRVGDTIEVWWSPNRDTIIDLKPYTGPLAYLWPGGAQSAKFVVSKTGMTIEPQLSYKVIARR